VTRLTPALQTEMGAGGQHRDLYHVGQAGLAAALRG